MKCKKCGKPLDDQGKCSACDVSPAAPERDAVDRILERLDEQAKKAAEQAVAAQAPPKKEAPPPPDSGPAVPEELAEQYEKLINAGKGKEALELQMKYLGDSAFRPAVAQIQAINKAAVANNFAAMRAKYGEKFTKREPLMKSIQSEMNVQDDWLVDMDNLETLFSLAIGRDRDAYVKEEAASQLEAAKKEWENASKVEALGGFAPAASILQAIPEEDRDRAEKIIERIGLTDKEVLYFKRQLAAYNERGANLSWPDILRQIEKEFDPRYTTFHRAGTRREKRGWTMVGEHPDDQAKIDAARRSAGAS